jgi:hypothetical protein
MWSCGDAMLVHRSTPTPGTRTLRPGRRGHLLLSSVSQSMTYPGTRRVFNAVLKRKYVSVKFVGARLLGTWSRRERGRAWTQGEGEAPTGSMHGDGDGHRAAAGDADEGGRAASRRQAGDAGAGAGQRRPHRAVRRGRGGPRGIMRAAACAVVMAGMLGVVQGVSYSAPFFMDYREGTHTPCEGPSQPDGCHAIADPVNALSTRAQGLLPIVNPPDGHVFSGRIGDDIHFYVAGQHAQGADVQDLTIIFEEDPSFQSEGALEYTTQGASDGSATSLVEQDHFRVFKPDVRLNPIARKYSVTVKGFAPSKMLTMCFRIMLECDVLRDACPNNDPSNKCAAGVDCAGCCFKDPPSDAVPQSALFEGMGKGADGNSDAPTKPGRACFRDKDGRCFNSRFNPRRCVRMYVAVPPQIVAVLPVDAQHLDGPVHVKEAAESWHRNTSAANVHVRAGQILRLNVDAVDANEEDDVDVMPAPGVELPAGAGMGPRMCCNSAFDQCQELPFGSHQCSMVCKPKCSTQIPTHHTNMTLAAACPEECNEVCERTRCRFVRRQLLLQPSPSLIAEHPGMWTGLKFVARDDSGRFSSTHDGLCCDTAHLTSQWEFVAPSPLAGGLSLRVSSPPAAFVDPMPGKPLCVREGGGGEGCV